MTASERLRELDARLPIHPMDDDWLMPPDETTEALADLRNALPLIADVVEAAVEMADWLEMQSSNSYGRDLAPLHSFDAAYTALGEHLEGGGA